jgi:hypothetical protein
VVPFFLLSCLPSQKGVTGASEAITEENAENATGEVSWYRCKSTICHVRRMGDCLVGRRTLSPLQFFSLLLYLLQFDRAISPLLRAGIAQGK